MTVQVIALIKSKNNTFQNIQIIGYEFRLIWDAVIWLLKIKIKYIIDVTLVIIAQLSFYHWNIMRSWII